MKNFDINIFNTSTTRCPLLGIDDMKFAMSYWFGQTKAYERIYKLDSTNDNALEFFKSFDIFIRTLYISGTEKSIVEKFLFDYIKSLLKFINKENIDYINKSNFDVIFIESIVILSSFQISEYKEVLDELEKSFQLVLNNNQFNETNLQNWMLLFSYHFRNKKIINKSIIKGEDRLLDLILNANKKLFNAEINNIREDSKKRGLQTLKQNSNSDFYLSKIAGFYDFSIDILIDGYVSIYNSFNE